MNYLLYIYFGFNIFFVGRYWEEFYIYKPSFNQMIRIFFAIIIGCLVSSVLVFFVIVADLITKNKFNIFVRKSHIQIGSTCYVWGGGLSSRKGEFIELSKFEFDKRFVVKNYKYLSIVNDAVS